MLVGGALTAVFVPQLLRSFSDSDGGNAFASRLITNVSLLLIGIVLIGVLIAPSLVRLYAPDFSSSGFETEFRLAVAFTRYCLPQIFFLGFFTMLGQVANAKGKFAPLMWAPIVNNLGCHCNFSGVLIASPDLSTGSISSTQTQILGWGTTLGLLVQALILIPVVKHTGIRIRPMFGWQGFRKIIFIGRLDFRLRSDFATRLFSYCKRFDKCCSPKRKRWNCNRCWFHTF